VIVERMKLREVQDRRQRRALIEAHGPRADHVVIRLRPAVGARHHAHAVGPQRIELAHRTLHHHRFDIGVAGQQQMRADAFQERRALLPRIGPGQQIEQRMRIALHRALVDQEVRRRDVLGDQLDRPVHDGVADVALARQRRVIARRPAGAAAAFELDELRGSGGFRLRRTQQIDQALKHSMLRYFQI
jgi:hypothetical protein